MQSAIFTKKLPSGAYLLEGENFFAEILHIGQICSEEGAGCLQNDRTLSFGAGRPYGQRCGEYLLYNALDCFSGGWYNHIKLRDVPAHERQIPVISEGRVQKKEAQDETSNI